VKLFIWEGNGISEAYHDDGTLVVLAGTVEQARHVARAAREEKNARTAEANCLRDLYLAEIAAAGEKRFDWTKTERGAAICEMKYGYDNMNTTVFDGEDSALDHEPDRILDIDEPQVVAFNGGGYD
jgi:hypothetical protein